MKNHESAENYLETIFFLEKKLNRVRSIDIANELNYSKPSVSRALGILKKGEFITVDENGYISFTDMGREHALTIKERHDVLTKIFVELGVSEETAAEDACKIEHVISDETFDAIKTLKDSNK